MNGTEHSCPHCGGALGASASPGTPTPVELAPCNYAAWAGLGLAIIALLTLLTTIREFLQPALIVVAPGALILGLIGLRRVRRYPELGGRRYALTGTIVGALFMLIVLWSLLNCGLVHWGVLDAPLWPVELNE